MNIRPSAIFGRIMAFFELFDPAKFYLENLTEALTSYLHVVYKYILKTAENLA
jgi:hypothetical protein